MSPAFKLTEEEIKKIEEGKEGFPTILALFEYGGIYIITEKTPKCIHKLAKNNDSLEFERVCNLAYILGHQIERKYPFDETMWLIEEGICPFVENCYTSYEFVKEETSSDLWLIGIDGREALECRLPTGNYTDLLKLLSRRLRETKVIYEKRGYEGISLKLQEKVVKRCLQKIKEYIKTMGVFL